MACVEPELVATQRALLTRSAVLLLANGQTTEGTRLATERLSAALRLPTRMQPRWGEVILYLSDHAAAAAEVEPAGIDIGRVVAVEAAVDAVCAGVLSPAAALERFEAIARTPPVSLARFALMAAAGAAALCVIFGGDDVSTVLLVAAVAGLGACLRRAAAVLGNNPLLQPAVASLLAGVAAGVVMRGGLPVMDRLVAVCPCMVLVPGPHFLNGMIDLARARIPLGAARLTLASLIVLVICIGLLAGLAFTGVSFPEAGVAHPVSLAIDVCAAGVVVAAYASFFNMPWRMVGVPVVAGMAAHALRWELLRLGADGPMGAFAATSVAGATMALVSHRLRLPFGAAAFACVVSLIPGIYLFQAASSLVVLARRGPEAGPSLLFHVAADLSIAGMTLLAMAGGLIIPKLCADMVTRRW